MSDLYEKYTAGNESPEPPAGLEQKIMRKVKLAERRALVWKTVGYGTLLTASISLLVAGYLNLMASLSQSGFFDIASLFFSDFSAAMANFQDFAFSIVESFPVFSTAFLIAGVIAVIWSAAHFIEDISEIRTYNHAVMTG